MLERWSIPLVAATLALPGCKDETPAGAEGSAAPVVVVEVEPTEANSSNAAPSLVDGSTPTTTAAPGRRVPLDPAARKPLIGHFRLASLERLIDKTRTQLVPAPLSTMVTTDGLRALFEDGEDELARGVVQHLDLAQPIVCGLADPLQLDEPFGCALGYQGGAAQLVADMGTKVSSASADGHTAHMVSKEGTHVYLDDRDGLVVISTDAKLASVAGAVLVALARAPAGRDLELVLYPAVMGELYLPLVRTELEQVVAGTRSGSELRKQLEERAWTSLRKRLSRLEVTVDEGDAPWFEEALADLDAMTPAEAKKLLAELDEAAPYVAQLDAVGLGFELEPSGLALSAWYDAIPGSALQAEALSEPKLDLEWVSVLPASSVLAGASIDVPDEEEGVVEERLGGLLAEAVAEFYEEQTGNPRALIEADLQAFLAERDELYGPRTAWAVYTGPEGPGALVVVRDNQPGKSGREGWARWAERFPAERILGRDAARYVTWEHRAGALEVEGVPVDRWSLQVTSALGDALREELFMAKVGETLVPRGGLELHIDRVEKGGRTSFVVALQGSEAFLRAALVAQGDGRSAAGLATILGRQFHPLSLWGLDLKKVAEALPEASGEEVPKALRGTVGTDLADVHGGTYLREDGGVAELVVSQRLIDQLRAAAMR
ncbi:MAG: hypothetical protein AB1Z98_15860 [Nannocystaceae bacterium]